MKKILSIAVIFIIVFSMFSMLAPQAYATSAGSSEKGILTKEWKYDMRSLYSTIYFGSSPAIANLLGSPDLEIVTGSDEFENYYPELGHYAWGIWRCFDSQGNLLWAKDTGTDESRSSPVIADINQDGYLEIVGGTTSGWNVEAMNRFGNFIWTFPWPPTPEAPFLWHSSPAVADIDASISGLEVVIGNNAYGNVWAFDGDNSDGINDGITATDWWIYGGTEGIHWDVLWVFQTGSNVLSSPALGDVDNDDQIEVVIGSQDRKVYVLNGITGALEWSYSTGGGVDSSAAIANLDGDPYLEVVIGSSDGKLYCLQWNGSTGSVEWIFPTSGGVYSSPAIGDIDGDGHYDIVVGSDDGKIYALNADGIFKWSYPTGGAVHSSAALANRGTAGLGVYIGSYDDYLYLIDGRTGTLIDRFLTYGDIYTSPSVADVDGDGKLEIFFYDASWSLDRYTFWALEDTGSTTSPYSIQWQMFRHDPRRTGLYVGLVPPTPAEWTFAIITDLHIGFGYPDYGAEGYDDRAGRAGQDYYLTDRLKGIVEWINTNPQIHFVVVLGDIADTAEYSEFLKAREILNNLTVPYIPVIGNHDVWPYTQKVLWPFYFEPDIRGPTALVKEQKLEEGNPEDPFGDRYFEEVFWQQNSENLEKIKGLFGDTWRRQEELLEYNGPPYMQNYVFIYKEVKFIALDFVERKLDSSVAKFHQETKDWLSENLQEEPTILFSHHPIRVLKGIDYTFEVDIPFLGKKEIKISAFDVAFQDEEEIRDMRNIVENKRSRLLATFAGHTHNTTTLPSDSIDNLLCADVVETEAVSREAGKWMDLPMVRDIAGRLSRTGKNIRIVSMSGERIKDYERLEKIIETDNLPPTSYFTYLPKETSLKIFFAYSYDPEGPFMFSAWECTYAWSFGDGKTSSSTRRPTHHYAKAGEYIVTLTVIDREGTISRPFSRTVIVRSMLEIIGWSPVDLTVTDPNGRTISKQLNEIPGATYIEFDLNEDGDLDDMVIIPDPLDGNYVILLIGTATGTYSMTTELVTQQQTITQTYSGDIVEGGILEYIATVSETDMATTSPVPPVLVNKIFKPNKMPMKRLGAVMSRTNITNTGYLDIDQTTYQDEILDGWAVPDFTKPISVTLFVSGTKYKIPYEELTYVAIENGKYTVQIDFNTGIDLYQYDPTLGQEVYVTTIYAFEPGWIIEIKYPMLPPTNLQPGEYSSTVSITTTSPPGISIEVEDTATLTVTK